MRLGDLLRGMIRPAEDDESVLGEPGPVLDENGQPLLDRHGEPVLDRDGRPVKVAVGPDGEPLMKVLVTTRRDYLGHPEEQVWADPRIAWQWDDTRWHDERRR